MTREKFKPQSFGSQADVKAGVEISKVHGGYFSSLENARQFCDIGIAPIEKELPHYVKYADFGGGEGFLARNVGEYITSHGHGIEILVADANEKYLKVAKDAGLDTILCNLEECNLSERDLITMRAVLHYNSPEKQLAVLRQTFFTLKNEGFFVSQVSSGTKENCELRSRIVNLPSLARATEENQYHWISLEEYLELLKKSGFQNSNLAGYAPSNAWSPANQWERFFGKQEKEAAEIGNENELRELEAQQKQFYKEANALIEQYVQNDTKGDLGVEKLPDGSYTIRYQYPIFISQK